MHEIQNYVLSIYVKRDNLIISSILYNEIKKIFIVNLIKYNNDTTTIAQYFIEQIIVNIIVVVAIRVALILASSLIMHLLLKLFSQFINLIKKFFS
jgi:hypothetical protein